MSGKQLRYAEFGRVTTDQFFTRDSVAIHCWEKLLNCLALPRDTHFVEPAAGAGAFYSLLPEDRRTGLDLEPRHEGIEEADFMEWLPEPTDHIVVVGNPPFGRRGRTALEFVNRALTFAETVAMILPMTFTRHEAQKQIPAGVRLAFSEALEPASFLLPDGEPYSVQTVFQIWTWRPSPVDLRLNAPLPKKHPDFDMWQYNNTLDALRYFNEPFDFAVPCQGWQDYSRRETDAAACEKSKQWMLLRPLTDWAYDLLYNLDYHRIAHEAQTSTPGFRKGTLVQAYVEATC